MSWLFLELLETFPEQGRLDHSIKKMVQMSPYLLGIRIFPGRNALGGNDILVVEISPSEEIIPAPSPLCGEVRVANSFNFQMSSSSKEFSLCSNYLAIGNRK